MSAKRDKNKESKKDLKEGNIKFRYRGFGFKKRHIARFFVKRENSFEQVGEKRIRKTEKIITRFRTTPFLINIGNFSFEKGLKAYYLFDILTGEQLFFKGQKLSTIPAEVLDLVVSKNIIRQIFSSLVSGVTANIMSIITGLAVGGIIGLIAGLML